MKFEFSGKHLLWMSLSLALAAQLALAEAVTPDVKLGPDTYVYEIERVQVRFLSDSEKRVLVDSSCKRSGERLDCDAFRALGEASWKSVKRSGGGGRSRGAEICGKVGGEIVMGWDSKLNQNSFCKFRDGSLVSDNALAGYGKKNDAARSKK